MIRMPHAGELHNGKEIDRVIEIHFGPDGDGGIVSDCLFRAEGEWFHQDEAEWIYMGGYNGGGGIRSMGSISDAEAEAIAEKGKAAWEQKTAAQKAKRDAARTGNTLAESSKKEPPRSPELEALLKRNAEAEIYRYEKPVKVSKTVRFDLPKEKAAGNPGDWFTGEVAVSYTYKQSEPHNSLDDLLRSWNSACLFRSPGELWYLTCTWTYEYPYALMIRRVSGDEWKIERAFGKYHGLTKDLGVTAERITESPIPDAAKGRWRVLVSASDDSYEYAYLTVEYADDWIYMDYDGMHTDWPGDRDIRRPWKFSKRIRVRDYRNRQQLVSAAVDFLNECESREKPFRPISENAKRMRLEKELFL